MAVVDPVPSEKAPEELKAVYETLSKTHGRVPNFFATMAHRPSDGAHQRDSPPRPAIGRGV